VGAGHDLAQARAQSRPRLTIVLALVTLYMIAEVIGGLLTNSLALLADAGHMLSDAAALALAQGVHAVKLFTGGPARATLESRQDDCSRPVDDAPRLRSAHGALYRLGS
jgi:hypothetical protein